MTDRDDDGSVVRARGALLDFLLSKPFEGREKLLMDRSRYVFRGTPHDGDACFSAHVDALRCEGRDWKLPADASTLGGSDPVDVMLFGCTTGVHVEIMYHRPEGPMPLPDPSQLTLLTDGGPPRGLNP